MKLEDASPDLGEKAGNNCRVHRHDGGSSAGPKEITRKQSDSLLREAL